MAEEFDDPEIGDLDLDRPLRSRFSQFQLWSSSQIANVARRPTDLLVLAACAVGLMLIFFLLPEDLLTGLSVNPGLRTVVDSTLLMGSIALIIWSLVIVGASVLSKTHRVLVVQLLIAVAIGWVCALSGVTAAIAGAKTPQQVRDNAEAWRFVESPEAIEVVEKILHRHRHTRP